MVRQTESDVVDQSPNEEPGHLPPGHAITEPVENGFQIRSQGT